MGFGGGTFSVGFLLFLTNSYLADLQLRKATEKVSTKIINFIYKILIN